MAVYSELGRIPVQSQRHINILKFFVRLCNLDHERYASKAFNMLIRDADSGCSNWISAARSLQLLYGVKSSDKIKDIKFKVRKHFESAAMLSLKDSISQDKKLKTYAMVKPNFKFETYLDVLTDFSERSYFAKLRLSAHNLQIEIGRFGKNKTPRLERFCLFCLSLGKQEVEDKVHF